MSFSYSGDPKSSLLDLCRFTLADTDENKAILTNEEIAYLVEEYGKSDMLWYKLFDSAATAFAKDCVRRSLGPQSEDATERLKYFKQQAIMYQNRATVGGLSMPKFSKPGKIFNVGMQSNPPFRP